VNHPVVHKRVAVMRRQPSVLRPIQQRSSGGPHAEQLTQAFTLHDDERRASDPDAERPLGWRLSATRASADAGRGWESGLRDLPAAVRRPGFSPQSVLGQERVASRASRARAAADSGHRHPRSRDEARAPQRAAATGHISVRERARRWMSSWPLAVTPPPRRAPPRSSSDGWIPTSASRRGDRHRGRIGTSGAGRQWRRPSLPISGAATGSRSTLGTTPCLLVASGRCGTRRPPRIAFIPTPAMSTACLDRTRSARCRRRRWLCSTRAGWPGPSTSMLRRPRTRCDDSAVGVDIDDVGLALATERVW